MNINQRNRILQNIDSLLNLTDFDNLYQACYHNQLLNATMIQNIRNVERQNISGESYDEHAIKKVCHRRLFEKITKRGPDAFEKLRKIFVDLKYIDALNILFGDDERMISISSSKKAGIPLSGNTSIVNSTSYNRQHSIPSDNNDSEVFLYEFEYLIQPNKQIYVQKADRIIIDSTIGTYPMESKNKRGIFFIVNSDDRQRQDLDDDDHSLLSLFQQLGFKLYAYNNITLSQFFYLLEELLNSDKINDIECFVLVVKTSIRLIQNVQYMTFNDGSVVKVEQIQKFFYHRNCKRLHGKPKIFLYPCSESPNKYSTQIQTESVSKGVGFKHVAQLSDVINCYATTISLMDERNNENYSRYIQCFVNVVAQHACNTHFENMLKMVQTHVGYLQMPSYDNISFNKMLYFNPGINL